MGQAFHQIVRYKRNSYSSGAGLFDYVQLFIISNGVNTKYFANNKTLNFKQTLEDGSIFIMLLLKEAIKYEIPP